MVKLHRQFGHASQERLRKLLNNAGVKDADLFKKIYKVANECELFLMYRKIPSRPAVSLPMAQEFNETGAVDLHQLDKSIWFLHIKDLFTQ